MLLWSRMPAFWSTLFSGINLANLAQAGSVALASWAIINGIDAWKREFIGKRRIELAEETLAKFFEVKDAIIMIRSPFGRIGEGSSRAPAPGETEAETEVLNRGYVVVERYQKAEKTFSDFQVLKYKFMAAFGHKTEEIFNETYKAVSSIFSAANTLARSYWHPSRRFVANNPEQFERRIREQDTFEGILWDSNEESDAIRQKLATAQRKLEEATKHCFEEQASSYTLLTKKWKWPWKKV